MIYYMIDQFEEVIILMRIYMKHDNKDRIICVTETTGKHKFYFQSAGTKARLWLFDTKSFSGSVFAFFRKYGRNIDDIGFSMTLRELYAAGNDHNVKINKVLDRIPAQVDYVLRERDGFVQMPYTVAKATPCEVHFSEDRYRDDERAA